MSMYRTIDVYLGRCQTSMLGHFAKTVNSKTFKKEHIKKS